MYLWLILAFIFAALEVIAVSKNLQRLEYVAKPAVMVCLFLWLYSSTGLLGNTFWFGLGILSILRSKISPGGMGNSNEWLAVQSIKLWGQF